MNTSSATPLQPVGLPRGPQAFVKFQGEFAATIDRLTREAIEAGRWTVPEDVLMDPKDPASWAYWLYKAGHPIVRGMPGHGIEEHFDQFRRSHFELLPEGFEVDSRLTMSVSGDLMCTRGLDASKDLLYERVAELVFGADIAYANLESTLTTSEIAETALVAGDTPKINLTLAQYETVISHRGRRFDVVQLANNHILDCGEEGIRTTLARLRADGVRQVGVNETEQDASRPPILELHDLRIGWIAHTFSVNFKPFPEGKPWIVNMTPFHLVRSPDISRMLEQIKACRDAGCDLVVVSLHWGLEFEFYPHPDQMEWARRFADAGADLVIGHHPHVAQPVEIYRPAQEPGRAVPILYSVGNLTTVVSHPSNVLSLVARVGLAKGRDGAGRRTVISHLDLTPVAIVGEETAAGPAVRLVPVAELMGQQHDARMAEYLDRVAFYTDVVLGTDWRASIQAAG